MSDVVERVGQLFCETCLIRQSSAGVRPTRKLVLFVSLMRLVRICCGHVESSLTAIDQRSCNAVVAVSNSAVK